MENKKKDFHPWKLIYDDFVVEAEKSRESLLTIGNGYLGSRGALEEAEKGDSHYPATYVAGLYNRLTSRVGDRDIVNEDFVACPNWHKVRIRIGEGEWLSPDSTNIISIRRELDFKTGVLNKEMILRDSTGKETRIISRRFASMADPHLMALKYQLTPLNYSDLVELETGFDGDIVNDGVARYRDLNQRHLQILDEGNDSNKEWLRVKTVQSDVEIALVSKSEVKINSDETILPGRKASLGKTSSSYKYQLRQADEVELIKIACLFTSKEDDSDQPFEDAVELIGNSLSYDELLEDSKAAWEDIWGNMNIEIEGDDKSQMLIRLHQYHLIVTASPHNIFLDAGIPARGLHGEAYRGHIFWDELYILPFYNLFFPEVAKSVLNYRGKRLAKAQEYAKEYGYSGAMFPWQSGSDGSEETQIVHLNPVSGKWGEDYSSLQRHISIAVAYNIWNYYHTTLDEEFMEESGYHVFFEICKFWESKATFDEHNQTYSIRKVMGPDEFHERHRFSPDGGVKDNAYTNIMVAWLFSMAWDYWYSLREREASSEPLHGVHEEQIKRWKDISGKLYVDIGDDGVIAQFHGYFELEELDWDAYRKKYGNIYRLDRILKAEGKSPDSYKLAKQADLLMTYYNLDQDEVKRILTEMGHDIKEDSLIQNYNYYIRRTSHGSTLSRVVHAYLANQMGDYELGWDLYSEALASDYTDIQGGTTAEGIHAGVMGGTVVMLINSFLGINFKYDHLKINPKMPDSWNSVSLGFYFRKCHYDFIFRRASLEIEVQSSEKREIIVELHGKKIVLKPDSRIILEY